MSGLLAGKVWQSDLASHLKPLAAALADVANDDGANIYPSVAYMAWLLGKGERSVQMGLAELKEIGVIEPVAFEKGGRGQPTEYHLHEEHLPKRKTWRDTRKGATFSPVSKQKGATFDTKGCNSEQERVQLSTERVQLAAPYPLEEPLEEPLDKTNTTARKRAEVGTRLPDDFCVTPALEAWAAKEAPDVEIRGQTDAFRDYWRGVPGQRGKKLDWDATWRNRMRDLQSHQHRGNGNGTHKRDNSQNNARPAGSGRNIAAKVDKIARYFSTGSGDSPGDPSKDTHG